MGGIFLVEVFEDVFELVRWDVFVVIGDVDECGGCFLLVDVDLDLFAGWGVL